MKKLYSLAIILILLVACGTQPQPIDSDFDAPLFTDEDIDQAALEVARSTEEIMGIEEGEVPEGTEVPFAEGQELATQVILPGVNGFIAYFRHDPNATNPWQLRLADQITDVKIRLYEGTRQIESVATTLDGDTLVFTMRLTATGNYEVYSYRRSTKVLSRLTDTAYSESNVSISADGKIMVWEGESSGRRAIFIREYGTSSFTESRLTATVDQFEPTISGDGRYLAFIRYPVSDQYRVIRYDRASKLSSHIVGTSSRLQHPSVSNDGNRIAWYDAVNLRVRLRDLAAGTTTTVLTNANGIEHPHLTSDGRFLTYGLLHNGSFDVFTRDLTTGNVARAATSSHPVNLLGMYWQKDSLQPITIGGTITRGIATSSLGSNGELSGLSSDSASALTSMGELITKAEQGGSLRVIIQLKGPFLAEGNLPNATAIEAQRKRIAQQQQAVLKRLSKARLLVAFETVPLMVLEVDGAELATLGRDADVAAVVEDEPLPPSLAETTAIVAADAAWEAGHSGSGYAVAVLDTGVDRNHGFLSGKVVSEACYSTTSTTEGYTSTTVCPNGTSSQTGSGSARPCSADNGCHHGTRIAGIAAGKGSSFSGVARDTNIIAVQVFSRFDSAYCSQFGLSGTCVFAFNSDIIRGLERVYALRNNHKIAAVNLSLANGRYTSSCDTHPLKPAIDNLRSVGIATVVSSGNDGFNDAINAPACISSAIAVGATTKSDGVWTSSNSSNQIALLAPGTNISSSVPGGGFGSASGTSMATPHVAGAWAIMRGKFPNASVDDILGMLSSTGVPLAKSGITKPRIKIDAALAGTAPPPATARVRLVDALTGATVREVSARADDSYSFSDVPSGGYYVLAYLDNNGNNSQDSGEMAGAFGGAARPQVINAISGPYQADITTGVPTEVEANNTLATANLLLLGTFMNGRASSTDTDFYKLLIPTAGTRTMETFGSCGSSGRADTEIFLYNASGNQLASNDDIDMGNWCSQITYNFSQAGIYYLEVRAPFINGDYTLGIR